MATGLRGSGDAQERAVEEVEHFGEEFNLSVWY
jgi:hypothetical protein